MNSQCGLCWVIVFITLSSPSQQYATGLTAQVIGKPSAAFFTSALKELGVEPQNVSTWKIILLGVHIV